MRSSEKMLRSVIREVIRENYMTDDGISYSSRENSESSLLSVLQDKVFISDCLNQTCEDLNNKANPFGRGGIPKQQLIKEISNRVASMLLSGLRDLGSSSRPAVSSEMSSPISGWISRILLDADSSGKFSYELPSKKSQLGWKFYNLTCQISPNDVPDVASIDDVR